jgi:hypothetical protein
MKYPSRLKVCTPWLAALRDQSCDLNGRRGIDGGRCRSVARSGRGSPLVVLSRGDAIPKLATAFRFFLSVAIAEEAAVADTVEAVG